MVYVSPVGNEANYRLPIANRIVYLASGSKLVVSAVTMPGAVPLCDNIAVRIKSFYHKATAVAGIAVTHVPTLVFATASCIAAIGAVAAIIARAATSASTAT